MSRALTRKLTRRWGWITPLVIAANLVFLPEMGAGIGTQHNLLLIAIYTLIVSGLNLSLGYAGELAFGQVATFASGAYATGILSTHGHNDMLLALGVAIVVAGIIGLVTGIPGLRLSHWTLGMVSFFMVVLVPNVVQLFSGATGGLVGLSGIVGPTIFGHTLSSTTFYAVVLVACLIWLYVVRNLIVSGYGVALVSLRESPSLVRSLGSSVHRLRIGAYIMGGIPAGIAGCFYAYLVTYIDPTAFTFSLAIAVLAASIVGGSASIWGAPVGAALLVMGPLNTASFERWSLLAYGVFLVAVGVLFGGGIAGLVRRGWSLLLPPTLLDAPPAPRRADEVKAEVEERIPGQPLALLDVTKEFGGLRALDGVTWDAQPGQVTAIIGPNGAGKTTALNAVSGLVPVSGGSVGIGGRDVTNQAANRLARHGLARTFQTPMIPDGLSVLEVVQSGRLSVTGTRPVSAVLRLPRYFHDKRADSEIAMGLLRRAGLDGDAHRAAAMMPLGVRRILEVLRAAAARPAIVLLDEPAAGLDEQGVADLRTLIRWLASAGSTVVLVEHNVPFVMSIADRVHVMDLGAVIASGSPEAVRNDPKVIESYLGRRTASSAAQATPAPS